MKVMNVDQAQIYEIIRDLFLFSGLRDEQVAQIASLFATIRIEDGQILYSKGEAGHNFYIIYAGSVGETRLIAGEKEETAVLVPGDFFGEEALLFNRPHAATIQAQEPTTLLQLGSEQFDRLLREYPQVKSNLVRTAQTREIVRSQKFEWLRDDEVIYQIARKHEAVLAAVLIGPLVLLALSLVLVYYVAALGSGTVAWIAGLVVASLLGSGAVLWGIWNYIDWGNDYYIVTNQRAVWIEKVIWLYDSRDEAPLNTILSVNVTTNFWGRLLGFGNVIVRTYTGEIVFKHLGKPHQMADAVEEYWHRAQQRSEREEAEAMELAIRRHLGLVEEEPKPKLPPIQEAPPPVQVPKRKAGLWERYFANFLRMRIEEGNVITWRKYWTVLVGKTWLPTLSIFIVLVLTGAYSGLYFLNSIEFLSPRVVLPAGILLTLLLLPWWFYNYVDWRNDIYQVTDKYIFDIERKPLGTEVKKSAPLENILSLEHKRVGFFGYLFNYGNVIINVGVAQFVFIGVHEPARVQQDVFNHMYALRRNKEEAEAAVERERIAEALTMYHRNIQDSQQRRSPYDGP
ncbi:MAG: cyclic nucleotide-binding domain-containing protein [Anaerolineales bacterium]